VLEPNRLLVLAEKGSTEIEELVAHSSFRIMATMNPGGDFGKKELSPGTKFYRFSSFAAFLSPKLSCAPSHA